MEAEAFEGGSGAACGDGRNSRMVCNSPILYKRIH